MNFKERYQKSNDRLFLSLEKKKRLVATLKRAEEGGVSSERENMEEGEANDVYLIPVESMKKKKKLRKAAGIAAAVILVFTLGTAALLLLPDQNKGTAEEEKTTPVPTVSPAPAKDPDSPEGFLSLFVPEKAENGKMYSITSELLLPYLRERITDKEKMDKLEAFIEKRGATVFDFVRKEQFFQTSYNREDGTEGEACIIILNGSFSCNLVFIKENEKWDLSDVFQCGEIEAADSIEAVVIKPSAEEAVTLLCLTGRLDHGTGYCIREKVYYDFVGKGLAMAYICENYNELTDVNAQPPSSCLPCYRMLLKNDEIQEEKGIWKLDYEVNFYPGPSIGEKEEPLITSEGSAELIWNNEKRRFEPLKKLPWCFTSGYLPVIQGGFGGVTNSNYRYPYEGYNGAAIIMGNVYLYMDNKKYQDMLEQKNGYTKKQSEFIRRCEEFRKWSEDYYKDEQEAEEPG